MKKAIIVLIAIVVTFTAIWAVNKVTTVNLISNPVAPNDTNVVSIYIGNTERNIVVRVAQCDTAADSLIMIAYTSVWEDSLTTKEDSCMNIRTWKLDSLSVASWLNIQYWVPDGDTFTGKVILSKQ